MPTSTEHLEEMCQGTFTTGMESFVAAAFAHKVGCAKACKHGDTTADWSVGVTVVAVATGEDERCSSVITVSETFVVAVFFA